VNGVDSERKQEVTQLLEVTTVLLQAALLHCRLFVECSNILFSMKMNILVHLNFNKLTAEWASVILR
jgi:hypothetical protein